MEQGQSVFNNNIAAEQGDFSKKEDFIKKDDLTVINYLISQGPSTIINFIACLAQAILQLEKLQIFHQDLAFRNMIKIDEYFKIIDFDLALFLGKISDCNTEKACKANTLQLINMLMKHNHISRNPKDQEIFLKIMNSLFPCYD